MGVISKPEYIITIGASAGGLKALNEIVAQFKSEWNIAVFIVIHLSKTGVGDFLLHRLQKYTTLTCTVAENSQEIERGHIYLAKPDQHLMVKDGKIILGEGPAENRWRPSIDVLFRSAAVNYNNRAIGIILTGYLNDGTSGMWAIKQSGGYTIVQDPNEAEYPDMPTSVLESMEVDHCVSLTKMGETIRSIINCTEDRENNIPEEVVKEAEIAEKTVINIDLLSSMGEHSNMACPDCGGGLWTIKNEVGQLYRCHIGHSYSENDLLLRHSETMESTLWIALRMMEERRNLLQKIATRDNENGREASAKIQMQKAKELEVHIDRLKDVLFSSQRAS